MAVQARELAESEIARAFVAARRDGLALSEYPGLMPSDLAGAYRVQDNALALAGGTVQGWKVGRINPPIDGIERLSGPIFSDSVRLGENDPVEMPVFTNGFAAAEAEFLLRIGRLPTPGQAEFTIDETLAFIDAVHVGIEIASSPFPGINSHGPTVTISDFGNNNGLVIGSAIPDWRDAGIVDWPVALEINGELAGAATAAAMLDGPFGAARFLFEHMAQRRIALSPGQWISTGAVTGVHPVAVGDRVVARFNNRYDVECSITAR